MFQAIVRFAVTKKLFVGLTTLFLLAGGIYAMLTLPVDAVPDITNNQVQIVTVSPTLAPQEVEQLITFPIKDTTSAAAAPAESEPAAIQQTDTLATAAAAESESYAATEAATVIVSGVGSLFGSGKMKKLEQSNEELHQEIAKRDTGIDDLKAQMRHMQEQHGRQIRNLQGIHKQELEAKDKEISRLNAILEKAFKWFPMLKEMLRMEKLCTAIGFTKEMIESLLTKKEAIRCNGRIYSEEHRRKFDIRNDIFKVEKNPTNDSKLVLTINRQPIGEWFKEQWEKLRQGLRKTEEPRKSRGFKL